MIERICIEGIDGSGKTSVANRLVRMFAEDGVDATVVSPYRIARERLGRDTYEMWRDNAQAKIAVETLRQIFNETSALPGIVIYDRHWMTALVEIGGSPELIETWGDIDVPAALLVIDPEVATARMENDHEAEWAQLDTQRRYDKSYRELAKSNFHQMLGIYRSEEEVTVDMLARAIKSDMYYRR